MSFEATGTNTNTTPERVAPAGPSALRVLPLWAEGSPVCEVLGVEIDDPLFGSQNRPLCYLETDGAWSPLGGSNEIPVGGTLDIAASSSIVEEDLDEAAVPALLKSLEQGPVGWVAGYAAATRPEGGCGVAHIDVPWKSDGLDLGGPCVTDQVAEVPLEGVNVAAAKVLESYYAGDARGGSACPASPAEPLIRSLPSDVGTEDGMATFEFDATVAPAYESADGKTVHRVECGAGTPFQVSFSQSYGIGQKDWIERKADELGPNVMASSEYDVAGGKASAYCSGEAGDSSCVAIWNDGQTVIESVVGNYTSPSEGQTQLDWLFQNVETLLLHTAGQEVG